MKGFYKYFFVFLSIFVIFSLPIRAENRRLVPLDMFLIIDASQSMENTKTEIIAWVNQRVVDQILMDGDRITIWSAGDRAEIIYSDTISTDVSKNELRTVLTGLETRGENADFSGALRELQGRVSGVSPDRMSYSMLITASAEGLEPVLSGDTRALLRWSRSERYERWQVLILAPEIGPRVQQAANEFIRALE